MAVVIFLSTSILGYLLLWWGTHRRRRMLERTQMVVRKATSTEDSGKPRRTQALPVIQRLAQRLLDAGSNRRLEKIQIRLNRAGLGLRWTAGQWLATKLTMTAVLGLLGVAVALLAHRVFISVLFVTVLSLLGWTLPEFWLSRRIDQRKRIMHVQFPSFVDLLTVSVEAGLGFDQAVARVVNRFEGPLSEELQQVLEEMRVGQSRSEALQRMASRVEVDVIRFFVSAVVQSELLGTSLSQVLRTQAAEVRREAKQTTQERAMKAPVKMLFPLVIFVFPSIFIVILGPAMIGIMKMLNGA